MTTEIPRCQLLHHGAAANSSPKVVVCIPSADCDTHQEDDQGNYASSELGITELVYASHLMLNVAKARKVSLADADGVSDEKIWNVRQTLRTSTSLTDAEAETAAANVSTRTAKRVITCVVQLKWLSQQGSNQNTNKDVILVCGFSDGSLTSWVRSKRGEDWEEHVLLTPTDNSDDSMSPSEKSLREDALAATKGRSVTDVDGYIVRGHHDNEQERLLNLSIVACSSGGAQYFRFSLVLKKGDVQELEKSPQDARIYFTKRLIGTPSNTVKFQTIPLSEGENCDDDDENGLGVFLVGTAAPRHNKIHVLVVSPTSQTGVEKADAHVAPKYSGSLTGHEDWITCFDWSRSFSTGSTTTVDDRGGGPSSTAQCCYLASGSQDAKIRLWKWITTTTKTDVFDMKVTKESADDVVESEQSDDDDDDEEEVIEGEARLEIQYYDTNNVQLTTSVYLEALLIGHEEMVTSVAWHPNPKKVYDQDLILFSSSMDRSIFLWSSTDGNVSNNSSDGVWTPIARVGSPSGILGGPVGSSLLGYLSVQIEPKLGRWIMGHAYGGALHFFSCEGSVHEESSSEATIEQRAQCVRWKAQPCITGHFDEVTDLCWEALDGDYLITVSNDATCRIWAPTAGYLDTWIEISRPQVHGYTLSAVTSLSNVDHKHYLVTGADEKELRAFDGTKSFLRMLGLVSGARGNAKPAAEHDGISRVDRAYMPSLGLSNKDSAVDGADEDTGGVSTPSTLLPIEKDLGSASLWPETRKLYGHNSEIVRVASTLSARTCLSLRFSTPHFDQILLASSTKARDVNTATIRLWDVEKNRCLQTLHGGHRSTVTALSFSPDGTYLASSGKDRRLCLWKRNSVETSSERSDLFFLASAINSSHKRIVWSVHFCPYSPTIIASGSRDGNVKLWNITEGLEEGEQTTSVNEYSKFSPTVAQSSACGSKDKPEAITSLAFSPSKLLDAKRGILAVGLENGFIQLWSVPIISSSDANLKSPPVLAKAFDPQLCHIGAIKKLAWRPTRDDDNGPSTLASCSSDNGCRIFSVWLVNE